MHEISARNVNDAWSEAIQLLSKKGVARDSRYGPVLEYPDPVVTRYERPWERVLFDPIRDANPFLHFFEGLWMLAGRSDVAYVKQFSSKIGEFSDNGTDFHGAYGKRWRSWFTPYTLDEAENHKTLYEEGDWIDQLSGVIAMLKSNPDDRRAVLQMWDPVADFNKTGKDFPCNTNIYFKVRQGKLYMTVCCRSNDIVWGCYGANAVHMSMLHQYVAEMCGYAMGPYHQISDSWHGYLNTFEKFKAYGSGYPSWDDHYTTVSCTRAMVTEPAFFDEEVSSFVDRSKPGVEFLADYPWRNEFFPKVAIPILLAWRAYKEKHEYTAMRHIDNIQDIGWRIGCREWLYRRKW